jgi:hypothetical protein
MSYDIIGDIHGQADKLEALLRKLGYVERGGCWSHPGRTAVFVGDFVDRGPAQLRAVTMARRMVEEGKAQAVMGNHEFNAIAWHTPDPENTGDYLRPHFSERWGDKNRHQHARFLAEVESDAALHTDLIGWFKTLPLWLDIPGIRVVHACWHSPFMDWLSPQLTGAPFLDGSILAPATREPEDETEKDNATPTLFKAVEALTKGIEIPLPEGHSFFDKDGFERWRVRVRWWNGEGQTYRQAAIVADDLRNRLPDTRIPAYANAAAPTDKPIFFGHYWMTGKPTVLSDNAACVDYSAGKDGPLVAYRWDGESRLSDRNLVRTDDGRRL